MASASARKKGGDEVGVWNQCVVPANRDDGFEVVADLLPPIYEDTGALELVEHTQRNQFALDCGKQLVPDFRQFFSIAQQGEIVPDQLPPVFKGRVMGGEGSL